MGDDEDEAPAGTFSSPPCFMHEVDPAYMGLAPACDAQQRTDVMRWRKAERRRRMDERLVIGADERRRRTERIAAGLDRALGDPGGRTIGVYWPFKGEPDLRPWMRTILSRGGRCALPVVVEKAKPLVFRPWRPGARLERGIWNIPVPADGEPVMPAVVIAPVVAFDRACFRLGYGGGYYDRTLAAMVPRPRAIGVGYAQAAIPSIFPQWHDIPMDIVVTEEGIVEPCPRSGGGEDAA